MSDKEGFSEEKFSEEKFSKEEFSFMKETIKERPLNKRKLFRRTVITASMAVIFGLVASFTFLVLEPVISNWLYPEEITKIEFPAEEEEILPEEMLTDEEITLQMEEEVRENTEKEIVIQPADLSVESYQELYNELYKVSQDAAAYMTTVTGVTTNADWLQDTVESMNSTAGIVVGDNGVEYLILSNINDMEEADNYRVNFQNELADANLKARDPITGLAVFSVRHDALSEEAIDKIQVFKHANSSVNIVGRPVIAIGHPLAQKDSISYGIVTSNTTRLWLTDASYRVLTTDMFGSINGSGAIINTSGEVLGIITEGAMSVLGGNVISVLFISDLLPLMEKMVNDEELAYIGIRGMDVTQEAHNELGVPYGAYVTEVDMDSPAMSAGILGSDVIVKIEEEPISNFREYQEAVLALHPGENMSVTVNRYSGEEYVEINMELTAGNIQ